MIVGGTTRAPPNKNKKKEKSNKYRTRIDGYHLALHLFVICDERSPHTLELSHAHYNRTFCRFEAAALLC